MKIIGACKQILPLTHLPYKGALADYREILYQQGRLLPQYVWKSGKRIFPNNNLH